MMPLDPKQLAAIREATTEPALRAARDLLIAEVERLSDLDGRCRTRTATGARCLHPVDHIGTCHVRAQGEEFDLLKNDGTFVVGAEHVLSELDTIRGLYEKERAEVERLRKLMPAVYGDGYQAGVDGDESDVLDVVGRLDEYLAGLPESFKPRAALAPDAAKEGKSGA